MVGVTGRRDTAAYGRAWGNKLLEMEISVIRFFTPDYLTHKLEIHKSSARMEVIMSEKVSIGILAVQGAFAGIERCLTETQCGYHS